VAELFFHAHSGLRYAVLLAAVIALLLLVLGRSSAGGDGRAGRVASSIFISMLDLQVLLGIATVLARPWFSALIGHIGMMILALASAHALRVAARKATAENRRYVLSLLAVGLPLLLIVAGITAIGRRVV